MNASKTFVEHFSLYSLAHLPFFRPCSADAIMSVRTHTHCKNKRSQLALVSHAACMWITGSPIVLPSFNSSPGATWRDVHVVKECQIRLEH